MSGHDPVASVVLSAFAKLSKNGKPQPNEYTVLAGIVLESPNSCYNLVSLATGTKCLPGAARAASGNTINDSHAEILARRAALAWIHAQLRCALAGPSSLFAFDANTGKFTLADECSFHLFISQPPCGDATIRGASCAQPASAARTGAKLLAQGGSVQVPLCSDVEQGPQRTGVLRRKPGRGDPTLSLSCR